MNKRLKFLVATLLCACVAQAEDSPASRIPPELHNCIGIERSSERLACFDRAIATLAAAPGDASKPAPSAESMFGVLSSDRPVVPVESAPQRDDLQSLTAKVRSLGISTDGSLVIHLDNGQSWRQLSSADLLLKTGDSVTINRAALGSFQLIVPSGRSAKVKRTR